VQELEQAKGIPVFSIIQLTDLIQHLEKEADSGDVLEAVKAYRERYGV
jgi:orotate phosphoribosyltransferase